MPRTKSAAQNTSVESTVKLEYKMAGIAASKAFSREGVKHLLFVLYPAFHYSAFAQSHEQHYSLPFQKTGPTSFTPLPNSLFTMSFLTVFLVIQAAALVSCYGPAGAVASTCNPVGDNKYCCAQFWIDPLAGTADDTQTQPIELTLYDYQSAYRPFL